MNQTNNSKEGYVTLKMDEFLLNIVDAWISARRFPAAVLKTAISNQFFSATFKF